MILFCFSTERADFWCESRGSKGPVFAPLFAMTDVQALRWGVGFALAVSVLLAGCDTSVQPAAPSDQYHYSIFGILNPVQDTQWVRVEPLAPQSSEGAPRTLEVSVILEHMESGRRWALRDSVMEVVRGEPQHNFWTTAPVDTGATYRLTVRNEEGDTTQAMTTTPDGPPSVQVSEAIQLPCAPDFPEANKIAVQVRDVEELAALQVRYFQTFQESVNYTFDWYDDTTKNGDQYEVIIDYLKDLQTINAQMGQPCNADSAQVITAAGGPDWPSWARYHDATIADLAHPDSFSNVQGGHGTLAGVHSDTTKVEVEPR